MIWRHRKIFGHTKGWYNSKKRYEFCRFFLWFLDPNCPNTSRPKLVNTLDQNVLIQLVSIIYNGNIQKFWHRKLRRKTWYSSKSLWLLPILLVWFLIPQISQYAFFYYKENFYKKMSLTCLTSLSSLTCLIWNFYNHWFFLELFKSYKNE